MGVTMPARAQTPAPTGTPPPDATALVTAPKDDNLSAPDLKKPLDGTSISLSAGAQLATGNTRLLAGTMNGEWDSRWGSNGIGASILGNYGQGAPPGSDVVETAENVQGRFRYDRYIIDQASLFLINTVRHDRFQGLEVRYNLDPGFKYLFLTAETNTLWVEAGYDFQYDVREDSARVQLDSTGAAIMGAALLPKTAVDHAVRLYAGFKHAFNEQVTLSTGLEYIQAVSDGTHHWLNYDALFAAKVGGGLALGLGFNARYDSDPLPGKKNTDTATTLSLIYSFSDAVPPKAPDVPCPTPAPAATPAPLPAPAPATTPAPASTPAPATMSPPEPPATMSPPAPTTP
jgi:putative salt-induced outer membrane protein